MNGARPRWQLSNLAADADNVRSRGEMRTSSTQR